MSKVNLPLSEEPPQPPVPPDPLSCCGDGCGEACVWVIYRRACKRYEAQLQAWQESDRRGQ